MGHSGSLRYGDFGEYFGELTKDTPREDLILSTKFTPQIEDTTPDAMQNMLDGSKERLHTDMIDIYLIHNLMDVEKYTPMLIPLAKSGQIKQIGVSNHSLAEIRRAGELEERRAHYWSILNQRIVKKDDWHEKNICSAYGRRAEWISNIFSPFLDMWIPVLRRYICM